MGRDGLGVAAPTEGAKMRRKGILALALVAMLTIGVGVAFAAKSYPTKIVFLGNTGPSLQDMTFFGDLNSNSKCVGARDVGFFKLTSYGYKLLDRDLSSVNGAWAVRGDLTGSPDVAIKVKRDTRKHGRVICKPATLKLTAGSRPGRREPNEADRRGRRE
jgi:hypothetical protein